MATKNVRVVGYLPPPAHKQLRQYMEEQSLTESAAIIKIVKHFFDGSVETETPDAAKEKDQAISELKADMAELKRRLAVLEQAVVSGHQKPFANSRTSQRQRPLATLPPQSCADLARRLGVSTGTIEEAYQQGEAYFQNWSKRMDPTKKVGFVAANYSTQSLSDTRSVQRYLEISSEQVSAAIDALKF